VVVNYADQTAADQQRQRILHGAAREASGDSDAAMAGARAAALRSPSFRPEMEIHDECRRPTIMSGEVTHEHVHYIVIEA
jgi:hypothetical protein